MKNKEELIFILEKELNNSKLSLHNKITALAQVLIDLGVASEQTIRGSLSIQDIKTIEQKYYEDPTIGRALILQGAIMLTWIAESKS
jgi:hypothetical protein